MNESSFKTKTSSGTLSKTFYFVNSFYSIMPVIAHWRQFPTSTPFGLKILLHSLYGTSFCTLHPTLHRMPRKQWLAGGIRARAGWSWNPWYLTEPWLPLRRSAECSATPYFIRACFDVVNVQSLQTLESWMIGNQDLCSAEFQEL